MDPRPLNNNRSF